MGVMNPGAVMKNIIPVVMAGVIGIYGLIVAVLISSAVIAPSSGKNIDGESVLVNTYGWDAGFKHFAAGICCGLSGVGAGYAIGAVGDIGVKMVGLEPRLFVGLVLIMIFAEAVALYGLIVSLILSS